MIVATYNKTENKMKLRKFAAMILVICIGAITLAAGCKSKAVSYTVTFDSGGGTAVAAQVVESGKTAAEPADPEKDNFTFAGWFTKDNEKYVFTTPVTSDLTLYAHWDAAKITYKVTFDNGGHGKAPAAQTVEKDKKAVNPGEMSETGWLFMGWFGDAELKTVFDFGKPITADTVVYAKWVEFSAQTYCTVTFVDGENSKECVVPKGETATPPYIVPDKGCVLKGWQTEGGELFDFDTPITEDITLTALWEKLPEEEKFLAVTFDCDGGTPVIKIAEVKEGESVIRPDDPTKTGFDFAGWYKDAARTEAYDFSSPVTENITLYAKWTPKANFTVTFDSKGGNEIPAQQIPNGGKAVVPETPVKEGNTFGGWYKDENCEEVYDFDTVLTSDITLYAKWVAE